MNATQHATRTLDTDPALLTPYQVGALDASDKLPHCPENYFYNWRQMYDYSAGFLAIRPNCEPALAMAAKFERQMELLYAEERAAAEDERNAWQS